MSYKRLSKMMIGSMFATALPLLAIDAQTGKEIIETKCTACHTGSINSGLSRISDQRKTPEGWYMTINRMQRLHGLSLTGDEEKDVIKYLADNQGLTPDEIKPYQYVLDKTPNFQEAEADELLTEMCMRCHSGARIGLQRRTAQEWDGLVNFHVGQFISFEVQALARDRDWFGTAQNEVVPYLEKTYGKNESEWKQYQKESKGYALPLSWTLYGHNTKDGDFTATLTLSKNKDESYTAGYTEAYSGKTAAFKGVAVLYSGSELRVSLKDSEGKRFQQILHIDPKESKIVGRVYETLHHELGSLLNGVATDKKQTDVVGIYPGALKTGETTKLTIVGANLSKKITLPKEITLVKTLSSSKNKIELEVETAVSANKPFDVKVGDYLIKDALVSYAHVDFIKVLPGYAIARYGAETEKIKKEFTQFEAVGYAFGPDGQKDTEDDIKLTTLPVMWNMKPHDEQAEEDKDIMYAGSIDRYTGLFTPSEGGPNPTRKLMANNVGNLTITATYLNGNETLEAESHLIVSPPKFVNPPIN